MPSLDELGELPPYIPLVEPCEEPVAAEAKHHAEEESSVSISVSGLTDLEKARKAFDTFDVDRSGTLDREEFRKLVSFPELQSDQRGFLTNEEIDAMIERIDASHDGLISFEEFYAWWCNPVVQPGDETNRSDFQAQRIRENLGQRSFFRNLRSFGLRPTFFCQICRCFESSGGPDSYRLVKCGHEYCRECLAGYLGNRVAEGQVYLSCFQHKNPQEACGAAITDRDVEAVAAQDTLNKYHRFKLQKEVKETRECSKCGHMQPGDPRHPQIICKGCAHQYCFAHGDAHPGTSCALYEQRHMVENAKNQAALESANAKPCPKCQAMTLRNGGCTHMRCGICNGSWCWLCGQEIDDSPTPRHYQYDPSNPNNPCAGKQFEGTGAWDTILADTEGWRRAVCAVIAVFVLTIFCLLFLPTAIAFFLVLAVLWLVCMILSFGRACSVYDSEGRACYRGLWGASTVCAGGLWGFLCFAPMSILIFILRAGGCYRINHMGAAARDEEARAAAAEQYRREQESARQQTPADSAHANAVADLEAGLASQ